MAPPRTYPADSRSGSPFDPPDGWPAQPSVENGGAANSQARLQPPDPPSWEDPYALDGVPDQSYAMESRAETLNVFTRGDSVRRGEKEYLQTGNVDSFSDTVAGEERVTVAGKLTEAIGRASRTVATELETTVNGRMATSAIGWQSNKLSGEDTIVLGGALTDTWTGGVLIGAAISDDLMAGTGVRVTAPADMWLNGLCGLQERVATGIADAAMVELYGTLFEREYGAGMHGSALAVFSGTVWQTQRVGFRPLMKTALGVRNLIPAGGAATPEATPPAPPAGANAGEGALIATDMAAGAGGTVQSVDNFQDMGRVAGAADELEDASELRHAEDTARRLEELTAAARAAEVESPSAMGVGLGEIPPRPLPDDFDAANALGVLDDTIQARVDRIEQLQSVVADPVSQINVILADKIDELSGLVPQADELASLPTVGDDIVAPQVAGSIEQLDEIDQIRRAELEAELARVPWPGEIAEGADLRRAQLEAEIDALAAIRTAVEAGEDPVEYLRQMGAIATETYGAADLRTQALADAAAYYSRLSDGVGILQDEIDLLLAARSDVAAGLDPRVSVQNAAAVGSSADAQRQASELLDFLNSAFDFGGRADDVDLPPAVGSADVLPPSLGDEARPAIDVGDVDGIAEGGVQYSPGVVQGSDLSDEARRLLDLEAENVADLTQEGATAGARLELDGPGGTQNTGFQPPVEGGGQPLQPQLNESGAQWGGESGAVNAATDAELPTGYQGMAAPEDAVPTESIAVSTDTQAVVDGVPMHELPEDFNWAETRQAIEDQYMDYRRASNWRGALAYADAKNGLSDELLRAISDFTTNIDDVGANADELSAHASEFTEASATQRYQELQRLLAEAIDTNNAEQAQRIADFLEQHDLKTYNMLEDLASRADEFEQAANAHLIDRHIDRDKLIEWLTANMMDAGERMNLAETDEAKDAASKELGYYHQLILAVQEGRSPLAESADQIALLQTDEIRQAERFDTLQQSLLEVLGDPEFHRTAADLGDDTFAPVVFQRPELADQPLEQVFQAQYGPQLFGAGAAEPDGVSAAGDLAGGDYVANRDIINQHAGDTDAARAPDAQPGGMVDGIEQRRSGILTNAGDDPNVLFDPDQVINRAPDELNDQSATMWARRMRDEARGIARRTQGGAANFMDPSAQLPQNFRGEIEVSTLNPNPAEQVGAANQYGNGMLVRDPQLPSEWDRLPGAGSIRSWDSAAQQRKFVRFGGALVGEGLGDTEEDREAQNPRQDLRPGNADANWWTGSGINWPTDPINPDEAMRHVPAPQSAGRRRSYGPSGWVPSRRPGFGRVADSPGSFPFSVREQVINDLMQGQRLDARHIDALQSTANDAVRADRIRHREWLRMSALMRSLRTGTVSGDARPFARALDWRTLGVLLDMLDSAASLA